MSYGYITSHVHSNSDLSFAVKERCLMKPACFQRLEGQVSVNNIFLSPLYSNWKDQFTLWHRVHVDGGRSSWESAWRTSKQRLQDQESHSINPETPLQSHPGISC